MILLINMMKILNNIDKFVFISVPRFIEKGVINIGLVILINKNQLIVYYNIRRFIILIYVILFIITNKNIL